MTAAVSGDAPLSPQADRSQRPHTATPREKQLTLLAAVLGTSVVFLDATVTSVALPAIRGDLGGGLAGQQWVTNAYLLTLSSLLLIGGSLGDVLGQKRVFLVGVAGFGITSALCAVASSIPELCVFRSMQGVCAALVTPTALAVIIHVFPEDERARAIGTWTALSSIVGVIGPFIGGVLIAAGSWRLIFLLNAPLVLVTVTLIARGVPGSASAGSAGRLDFPGALLAALALSGSVFAVTEQPARGWSTLVVGSLAAGILGAIAFIAREARARAPMLPLSLFRERNFTIGNLATLTAYLGLGGVIFLLPVFLQEVSGYSPIQAGLALLPVTSLMIVLSRRFGALADRIGSRVPISLGALVAAGGLLLLARVDQHADYLSEVLPALLVFGLGLAMLVAPLTATVLGAVRGGSRRRRSRGEYDALTRRAAFRGRRAGSRRLSCVCQSRRRDATTVRDRSRRPRGDQPRQATASRLAQPGGSAPRRAGSPTSDLRGRVRACLPCRGHDRSHTRRQRRSDCVRRDP